MRRRVLVVDDNLDAAEALALALRHLGHEVEFAVTGEAALKVARRMRAQLVFLDLSLPGMNGYDVAAALRKDFGEGIRIVAVTGMGRSEDQRRSSQAGCDAYFVKPLEMEVLESLLAALR